MIKKLREEKGYTQHELSTLVGCSRGHLSCIEIGREFSLELMYKLCVALGCDFNEFLPSVKFFANNYKTNR